MNIVLRASDAVAQWVIKALNNFHPEKVLPLKYGNIALSSTETKFWHS